MQVTGTRPQKTEPQNEGKQLKTEPEGQHYAHGCQKQQVLEQQGWKTKDQQKAANLHYFTCTVMQNLRIHCNCRMSYHGMRVERQRKQNIQNGKAVIFPYEGREIVGQKPALAVNKDSCLLIISCRRWQDPWLTRHSGELCSHKYKRPQKGNRHPSALGNSLGRNAAHPRRSFYTFINSNWMQNIQERDLRDAKNPVKTSAHCTGRWVT